MMTMFFFFVIPNFVSTLDICFAGSIAQWPASPAFFIVLRSCQATPIEPFTVPCFFTALFGLVSTNSTFFFPTMDFACFALMKMFDFAPLPEVFFATANAGALNTTVITAARARSA